MKSKEKHKISFWSVFWFIVKITFIGFGGGNALMPIIKRECVDKKQWLPLEEFDKIVIVTNMLPGPSVIQTTGYIACVCLGKTKGTIATITAMLPHVLFAFLLFKLFNFIPLEYVMYIAIGTLISIIVFLIAFAYRYLKESSKQLSAPLWIGVFAFSLCYTVFVPAPYNIPIIPILFVFFVYVIVFFIQKAKLKKEGK
ncbi:chromate transporter [Mycoplasma hafezii]|uniref:chromate transporter n=1 Tax=Mycoplasma hafezii TaxID=525886 RepID=UPI003CF48D50